MQSLGVSLTVPLVSAPELETLRVVLAALSESSPQHDGAQNEWEHCIGISTACGFSRFSASSQNYLQDQSLSSRT
jgi:hypothetical protein